MVEIKIANGTTLPESEWKDKITLDSVQLTIKNYQGMKTLDGAQLFMKASTLQAVSEPVLVYRLTLKETEKYEPKPAPFFEKALFPIEVSLDAKRKSIQD